MGIFGRNIDAAYSAPVPAQIVSPWSPQDSLVKFAINEALGGVLTDNALMTRDVALRIPGVKRAHGIVTAMFARVPFYVMNNDIREVAQPAWTSTSQSGISPYHSKLGIASDLFFYGWACVGFNTAMTDCMHVPYGLWTVRDTGAIEVDEKVPAAYRARPVLIPLGYGDNGLLVDGADTLRQARKIEAAYQDRLDNPIPLTMLNVPQAVYESWTDDELDKYLNDWVKNRRSGATALKIAEWPVEMPGQVAVDLYETGRNAARLDIANHTSMPAGLLEGLKQGGSGGTDMHYTTEAGGAHRAELWDFGLPSRFVAAYEARMSLDDIVPSGRSVRADLTGEFATLNPNINPTRED